MMRLTVGQRMAAGFTFPAIILTVIGCVGYLNTANLIENNEKVQHAHEVLGGIESLLSYMKDVETSARGFAIAGREEFLEPLDAAVPEVETTFNKLKTLIQDSSQKSRLESLRPLLTARVIRAAGQAGDTIKALTDTLAEASQATAQIVASAGQQAAGMSQIHQAIRNIDQVTRQNLTATRQAEQAAQDLNSLGNQLAVMIAR